MDTNRRQQPKRIVFTDADGLSANTERALLILQIMRNEIESKNCAGALERLMVMADTRENVLLYRESLIFSVDGYDDDPRELNEIPEVRDYFSQLTTQWPHWFWFLCRDDGYIRLLMSLICEIKISRDKKHVGYEFVNTNREFSRKVADLLERGISLYVAFDISEEQSKDSMDSALNELGFGVE